MLERAPRYDIHESVQIRLDSGDEFWGVSLNISESGALLRTDVIEPRGTEVDLVFPAFSAAATVIWTKPVEKSKGFLLGVKFTGMSRKDRKALNALLELPAEAEGVDSFRWGTKARTPLGG